ncbi:MAG: flavodoxin-dependent (E)-4-hydroxy-3-methylbut-2-enyl-diphosphate synthase, partial [Candidatus Cloacimonetes bacterium]|nr:flavodoxin-dependent (E)-4-hydroxy-3-methylbut-2-enyl-diphosphate synthase [Candidatus Cloacimonadota bacterium]
INIISLAEKVEKALEKYADTDLSVAVMGCIVNGPGEARVADFGIAGGIHEGLLFKKGEIVRKVKEEELVPQLIKLIEENVKI